MPTALRIGPHDHGREVSYEEFLAGEFEEGYRYELIEGSLSVSPQPRFSHDWIEQHVSERLMIYKLGNGEAIRALSHKSRVFIPGRRRTTCPEPDIAVFRDFPARRKNLRWEQVSPFIVVEIVSPGDAEKDYVRNVELYRLVPSILEYWVFDKVDDDDGPILTVYRRQAGESDWVVSRFECDACYTTPLLPEFSLPVSPEE